MALKSNQIMPQNCKMHGFFVKSNIYTSLESYKVQKNMSTWGPLPWQRFEFHKKFSFFSKIKLLYVIGKIILC